MSTDPLQRFISHWGETAAMMRSAGATEDEIREHLGPPPADENRQELTEDENRQELTEDEEALLERLAAAIDAAGGGDPGGE